MRMKGLRCGCNETRSDEGELLSRIPCDGHSVVLWGFNLLKRFVEDKDLQRALVEATEADVRDRGREMIARAERVVELTAARLEREWEDARR